MTTAATFQNPSPRTKRMKDFLLSSPIEVDIERARFYTESWQQTEEDTPCIRAAKALKETLLGMNIRIEEDDLLAGVRTFKKLAAIIPIERNPERVSSRGTSGGSKKFAKGKSELERNERQVLQESLLPYWQGKTAGDIKRDIWLKEKIFDQETVNSQVYGYDELGIRALDTQGHVIPGYRRVLDLGFKGIAEWAERRLKELKEESADYQHQKDFLQSVSIIAEAVRQFSDRYADLSEKLAGGAQEPRRSELLRMTELCRRVPWEKAQSFRDALQSIWLTHVILVISYGLGDVFSTGRIDQYHYPYYKADLEARLITREEAQELIEELHLKFATSILPANYTITIGGLGPDGNDATNDLSYMFLEALKNIGGLKNNISVRISPQSPRDFLIKAWEIHKYTGGAAFYNDEIIVRDLKADGYLPEDARDYGIVGCVEPTTSGKDFSYTAGNAISLVKALEFALNEGRPIFGKDRRIAAPTLSADHFKDFKDVKQALAQQVRFCAEKAVQAIEVKDRVYGDYYPSPALSATIEGCLESGKDVTCGGAVYNNGHIGTMGIATVVDSLAAIRYAVFEKGLLSLPELVGHLRNNFEGAEKLRQELIHKAPKYGNDDPKVDELAEWVVELFCQEVRMHRCGRGGLYRPLILSSGFQVAAGLICAATADGRLSQQPLSDGISPGHGTEKNGLTAVLHSAALAGKALVSDGTTLTLNLSPLLLKNLESLDKLASMTEAYFELGGRQVQFTPVDTETLKDAQDHPQNYPDLTVKVSGYSAIFVDLPKTLQDDILSRTEFCEV
jgi:pyruvate formate-lyase/glycerol dehydratase family glycyl radical enzyme